MQVLVDVKLDVIFNVFFVVDLGKFVCEGNMCGLFDQVEVVLLLIGEFEYFDLLKNEVLQNWIVIGYFWYVINIFEYKKFVDVYCKKFNDYLCNGLLVGYSVLMLIVVGIKKVGSIDVDKFVVVFLGLKVEMLVVFIVYCLQDYQFMLGVFVGCIGIKDGKGIMISFSYVDGVSLQLLDVEVKKLCLVD